MTPLLEKFKNSKYIFVVGIGGSDLASKAVWNAMSLHKSEITKKIFFLESPDEREYEEMQNLVEKEIAAPDEIVLIVVSKSGETAETLAAFHQTFDILSEKFGAPVSERSLIISTANSALWKLAEEKGIEKISWEGNVGGRFSAFTEAHTLTLKIAGLDAVAFIQGGKEFDKESAKQLAAKIFESYGKGANILDFFIFNSELEDLGKWCRQLIAESLSALTPTVSLGPVDLHSMLELYLGGPKNRFTVFLRSLAEIDETINETAFQNVTAAYEKEGLPFMKYEMPEINEREIGKFMGFMIAVTVELSKLLGVDPYDQPAVENYKKNLAL